MTERYQVCTRCVMDTSATDISFDDQGVCNYCSSFLQRSNHLFKRGASERQRQLQTFVTRVKRQGVGRRYDCVVGVSGGVDSSWALVQAVKVGLRPLAVHMDNGWNSELAQNNIANLVKTLGVDLHTHVIDWEEYRSLMQAFFDADVIDVELLYDNAMFAVNYRSAAVHGVKSILAGSNQATEGMYTPRGWNWFKYDKRNIKALAKRFGGVKIRTFPLIGTFDFIWYEFVRRIRWTPFLDLFDYNKFEAVDVLQRDFGYKPYPFKHYESIFTRFYQGYILREKFGVDKRRLHLGTLVAAGQLERAEALRGIEGIPYPSEYALEDDKRYFLKKMGWTMDQLALYLRRPAQPHDRYGSERAMWDLFARIYFSFVGKTRS